MIFHFFHLLWTVQVFFYFSYLVMAGAVANWFFCKRNQNGKKIRGYGENHLPYSPVWAATKRTIRYHIGTVCLCALIIAIVQMIRAALMYVKKQTKGGDDGPNKFQKALLVCLSCCFKVLECCLDKLNKNALIWTAIWGDGFLTAACSSFQLIWRNLFRVAALNVVSISLLTIGQVSVALVTTSIAGISMTKGPKIKDLINSPLAPSMVVFIVSYTVAGMFMTIFDSIIDTIFLCFLVDTEHNKDQEMFSSESLQQLVKTYSAESKKIAKEKTGKLHHELLDEDQ